MRRVLPTRKLLPPLPKGAVIYRCYATNSNPSSNSTLGGPSAPLPSVPPRESAEKTDSEDARAAKAAAELAATEKFLLQSQVEIGRLKEELARVRQQEVPQQQPQQSVPDGLHDEASSATKERLLGYAGHVRAYVTHNVSSDILYAIACMIAVVLFWYYTSARRRALRRQLEHVSLDSTEQLASVRRDLHRLGERWNQDVASREEQIRKLHEECAEGTKAIDRLTGALKSCDTSSLREKPPSAAVHVETLPPEPESARSPLQHNGALPVAEDPLEDLRSQIRRLTTLVEGGGVLPLKQIDTAKDSAPVVPQQMTAIEGQWLKDNNMMTDNEGHVSTLEEPSISDEGPPFPATTTTALTGSPPPSDTPQQDPILAATACDEKAGVYDVSVPLPPTGQLDSKTELNSSIPSVPGSLGPPRQTLKEADQEPPQSFSVFSWLPPWKK